MSSIASTYFYLRRPGSAGVGMVPIYPASGDAAQPTPVVLYVTGGGVVNAFGLDSGFFSVSVPNNYVLPVYVQTVMASGTTASGIMGIRQ